MGYAWLEKRKVALRRRCRWSAWWTPNMSCSSAGMPGRSGDLREFPGALEVLPGLVLLAADMQGGS